MQNFNGHGDPVKKKIRKRNQERKEAKQRKGEDKRRKRKKRAGSGCRFCFCVWDCQFPEGYRRQDTAVS